MSRAAIPVALLWVEAIICFGPLVLVLLLGALIFPIWVVMLAAALIGVAPWVDGAGRTMWDVVWPMMFVLGGAIGLAGLVRILVVLSERDRPAQRSTATTIMVLVGLLALASFNLYDGVDTENLAALLVYVLLPGIGSLHLLYLARAVWLPNRK